MRLDNSRRQLVCPRPLPNVRLADSPGLVCIGRRGAGDLASCLDSCHSVELADGTEHGLHSRHNDVERSGSARRIPAWRLLERTESHRFRDGRTPYRTTRHLPSLELHNPTPGFLLRSQRHSGNLLCDRYLILLAQSSDMTGHKDEDEHARLSSSSAFTNAPADIAPRRTPSIMD